MPWEAIIVIVVLSLLITVLMRPDIFLRALRGGSGGPPPRKPASRPHSADESARASSPSPKQKETEHD